MGGPGAGRSHRLAQSVGRRAAGSARFAFGGLTAPLVGLGSGGITPFAVVLTGSTALAALTHLVLVLLRDPGVRAPEDRPAAPVAHA